jgi:predicted MFS family arabinose efflux permease
MAVVCVPMFAIWLSMPLAPNFLQERWGLLVSEVGLLGSAASLGQVVLALILGTRPPRRSLMALQAGATVYLLALLSSGRLEWLALGFFLRGGAQISGQFIDAISTRVVPPSQQGLAYGINALVNRGTYVAAAAAAGWLYSSRPALPFQASLALIPIAIGLIYLFVPRPALQE